MPPAIALVLIIAGTKLAGIHNTQEYIDRIEKSRQLSLEPTAFFFVCHYKTCIIHLSQNLDTLSLLLLCFSDNTRCITLILQSGVFSPATYNTTAWSARCAVNVSPVCLCKFKPMQMWQRKTFVVTWVWIKWCIINHACLKHSKHVFLSPKLCSFCFHHLFVLKWVCDGISLWCNSLYP